MSFSPLIRQLIDALRTLPGVGQKTAQRMALQLLERDRSGGSRLASALSQAMERHHSQPGAALPAFAAAIGLAQLRLEFRTGGTIRIDRNRLGEGRLDRWRRRGLRLGLAAAARAGRSLGGLRFGRDFRRRHDGLFRLVR